MENISHPPPESLEKKEPRYANYLQVGYNAYEFILEFGQYYADQDETCKACIRIVTSPIYAKAFLKTLRQSVDEYEQNHGAIEKLDAADT